MSDEYTKFLEEIHGKNFTTDNVISDVVKDGIKRLNEVVSRFHD